MDETTAKEYADSRALLDSDQSLAEFLYSCGQTTAEQAMDSILAARRAYYARQEIVEARRQTRADVAAGRIK